MTTKFPPRSILLELVQELAVKHCVWQLTGIRTDINQLADDFTKEKMNNVDAKFRIPLKRADLKWRTLDKLLGRADGFYSELRELKLFAGCGPMRKIGKSRKLQS